VRVLVTGATGLIGKAVTKLLLKDGWDIHVLARSGTEGEVPRHARIAVSTGSLMDRAVLEKVSRGVDAVIHLAGLLPGNPVRALAQVNVEGTANVARACSRSGVPRLVFVSSTSVYRDASVPLAVGLDEKAPLRTDAFSDLEEYGLSKVNAERQVLQLQHGARYAFVIVRAPIVYGAADGWDRRLVEAVRQRPGMMLRLSALPTLQCVHLDDLARGLVLAASHSAAANQIFNMAGAELFSLRDLVRSAFPAVANWPGQRPLRDPEHLKYDIRKARSTIGWAPVASVEHVVVRAAS
jgi:UDP-glucose 4-epimerase